MSSTGLVLTAEDHKQLWILFYKGYFIACVMVLPLTLQVLPTACPVILELMGT